MPLVGVTGGYATGKSFVASLFVELGAKLIDCDLLAKEAVRPRSDGFRLVVNSFGEAILGADGSIDRAKLAQIVFDDPAKRVILESILHPIIINVVEERAKKELADDPTAVVAVEAALLFESGLYKKIDKNIVVVCNEAEQIKRAIARDHLPEKDVQARIAAQWALTRKQELGDFLIDNNGSKDETQRSVKRLYDEIVVT